MRNYLLWLGAAAGVAILTSSVTSTSSRAEVEYPWCARSSTGQSGSPKCSYATLEQCQAKAVYNNGWCERNARIVWQEQQTRRGTR